jgi:DNA repair protein RecN (Recombination protein N)
MTSKPPLKSLRIKNIGIISDLEVKFGAGLNILTGETGTGKSMVLSALNLVLGGRAEPDMLRQGTDNAVAEAVFDAEGVPPATATFAQSGIEPDNEELLVRRTLQKEGKNKAFVNGSAVNLASLKSAGETMVDIHGQHEHQSLLNKETHLYWLDAYLALDVEREAVAIHNSEVRRIASAIKELDKKQEGALAQKEFLEFKADELEKAAIKENEEATLGAEHKRLASAEKIRETGAKIFSELYDSDASALSRVESAAKDLEKLGSVDPFFSKYSETFADLSSRISEAAMEINSFCSATEDDPARMGEVEARLSALEKLKRKYKTDLPGLLKTLEDARSELATIETSSEGKEKLEKELRAARDSLQEKAAALHKKRTKGIAPFKKEVQKDLKELNMAGAVFEVETKLEPDEESGFDLDGAKVKMFSHGFGEFQFLISANEGQEPKPLVKIASGGEISRVMLALKTATGAVQPVPVLVFDEIDVGIGGKTADMVGEKLKKLSQNCQIICITHLAQIARQADNHFVVEKKSVKGETTVSISLLDEKGRIEELARMGAGKVVTDAAREHAKEMIRK